MIGFFFFFFRWLVFKSKGARHLMMALDVGRRGNWEVGIGALLYPFDGMMSVQGTFLHQGSELV